jgi:hypothetical protein
MQVPLMESVDLADVHGGLQALTEIAVAYKEGVENVDAREKYLQNVSLFGVIPVLCAIFADEILAF